MTKTIENLFFYSVSIFDLLVIIIILSSYQKLTNKKVFLLLIAYCLLNSICNHLPGLISLSLSYPILVFFTFTEYMILACLFSIIINNKKFHKLIIALSIIFSVIVFMNYDVGKLQKIDSLPIGIETIIILIYSFYYLFEQMNIVDETFIYNRFSFWIVIGSMIYLGGSFFIYIFADKVDMHILDDYWFLTYGFYIIKNVFFIVSVFLNIKKQKRTYLKKLRPYIS